ncbi:Wzz/FepE/Etk N-terminal domain-containing protein [Radicibacter daui]|uniref:Wzz/FepE/Etk N-terminal domain-containing protein n=1 Tax=Radicibacter daui TaxID=3064829 RepID=UPI004046A941
MKLVEAPHTFDDPAASLSFASLMRALLRGWWVLTLIGLLSIAAAVFYLSIAIPTYKAAMMVVEVKDGSNALLKRLQGGASLLGLAAPSSSQNGASFEEFTALLTSHRVAEQLAQNHSLLQEIYAQQWDEKRQRWIEPQGSMVNFKNAIKRMISYPQWTPPDARDLVTWLSKNVHAVNQGSNLLDRSSLWEISVTAKDPDFAQKLLEMLYQEAETILRDRRRNELQGNIDYLQKKILDTNLNVYRESLVSMVAQQEQELMVLRDDVPIAARVLDPVTVSNRPVSPRPVLVLALALVLGGSFGTVAAILWGLGRLHPKGPAASSQKLVVAE